MKLVAPFLVSGFYTTLVNAADPWNYYPDTVPTTVDATWDAGIAIAGQILGNNGVGQGYWISGDEATAAFGNVKTIAQKLTADSVRIYYEYFTDATTQRPFNSAAATLAIKTNFPACSPTYCGFGDALDGGESLSTHDILLGGAVNGNGGTGSAYIFKDTGFRFTQMAELIARDGANGDDFGYSVSVDEFNPRKMMVGAPLDDDLGSASGSAYIFAGSPTGKYWTEGQKLLGAGANNNDRFGDSVDMFGRQAIVSAPGNCELYFFEEEKPKPPPPKDPCSSPSSRSKSSKTLRGTEEIEDADAAIIKHFSSSVRQLADIHQTKTLQWSQQQVLGFTVGQSDSVLDCTGAPYQQDTNPITADPNPDLSQYTTAGDLQISMYDGTLVVGVPYSDTYSPGNTVGPNIDAGKVMTYNLQTFKGPCTSELIPLMLSFTELVEMRDAATRSFWEEWGTMDHGSNSSCKRPKPGPKPVPMCEVSRWSLHQIINPPDAQECGYFGSSVDIYGDVMVVQERNMDYGNIPTINLANAVPGSPGPFVPSATPGNCGDPSGPQINSPLAAPSYMDGGFHIYRRVDGQWVLQSTVEPDEIETSPTPTPVSQGVTDMMLGQGISVTGTDIYAPYYDGTNTVTKLVEIDEGYECAIFNLGDHFGDGWNGAELVITQQDGVQERYAPYCGTATAAANNIDNMGQFFRWCPHNETECGEITVEIPRSETHPFHWEIQWGVMMEETDVWVIGQHNTKMVFNWDCTRKDLSLVSATHVVKNETCSSGCQKFMPTHRPTPWTPAERGSKSDDDKYSPTPTPTSIPTAHPTSPSDGRKLGEVFENEIASLSTADETQEEEENSSPRVLKKSHLPHTQHPTLSPAPTMVNTQTKEHWEFLTMSDTGSSWYSGLGRTTEYYISTIDGKHLLQSGTKCNSDLSLDCWQELPPYGDFILRLGGNLNPSSDTQLIDFCGKTIARETQLTFRISNHECTPLSSFTRNRYCTEYLDFILDYSGILLIHGVFLDAISETDSSVLRGAFASIFGYSTDLELTAYARKTSEGSLVVFELKVPITNFGYEQNDFTAIETAPAQSQSKLYAAFESNTFITYFNEEISSYLTRGSVSSFSGHGGIVLKMLTEGVFEDSGGPGKTQLDPISFLSKFDESESDVASKSSWFDVNTFFGVIAVGAVVLAALRYRGRQNSGVAGESHYDRVDDDSAHVDESASSKSRGSGRKHSSGKEKSKKSHKSSSRSSTKFEESGIGGNNEESSPTSDMTKLLSLSSQRRMMEKQQKFVPTFKEEM